MTITILVNALIVAERRRIFVFTRAMIALFTDVGMAMLAVGIPVSHVRIVNPRITPSRVILVERGALVSVRQRGYCDYVM